MNKISKEFKAGVLVGVGILAMLIGSSFLKGINLFKNQNTYRVLYEKVDGLLTSSAVMLNGHKVGQVTSIEFESDTSNNLLVEFVIYDDKLRITQNSIANITGDLFGSKTIDILINDTNNIFLQDGGFLVPRMDKGLNETVEEIVEPIKTKAFAMITSIEQVMDGVQAVLGDENTQKIPESFKTIERAVRNFERVSLNIDLMVTEEKSKLSGIFSNLESTTTMLKSNNNNLDNAIGNFSTISDSLAAADFVGTINRANKAVDEITVIVNKINIGEGTMGMLLNNDSLYTNLIAATDNLDRLLLDMKTHPNRYVHFSIFGRKEKDTKLDAKDRATLKAIINKYQNGAQ